MTNQAATINQTPPAEPSPQLLPDATPGSASPAIRLHGLAKSYGAVRAVDGVDLEVQPGSLVAMLGPNGAGKTTINEMLTGLVQPDHGRVEIFGLPPRAAVTAGSVGIMLQAGALLHEATTKRLLSLMHGLFVHPLPLPDVIEIAALDEFLTTKTDKLSGGQAQRLRFALAIMPDPELLILDEPTVGMDVEARRKFWDSIKAFAAGGHSVLFATHYLEEADQIADRIVVLNRGRIVADGTGAEIKSRVGGRAIEIAAGPPAAELAELPAVTGVEPVGQRLRITSSDSDATLKALLDLYPDARDIEVTPARLEEAFVALTETSRGGVR
jgi:ABC-2 type transport system ATP-binding protein